MIDTHQIEEHRDLAPMVGLMVKPVKKRLP